jgi:ATP-dependent Lhr-like helicase
VAADCHRRRFRNLRRWIPNAGEGRGRTARPRHAAGRWALLRFDESALDVERFAAQLLLRWGVIFRDLLARESLAPAWRDLLMVLRRMEARGEVRGGRFVAGFSGEQFARPEAVDLLRVVRRAGKSGEEVLLPAADPLNLAGVILPGARTSAIGSSRLLLKDGVPSPEPSLVGLTG